MERYHGLDAVRAGAMLLGVVLHGMLIYTEPWLYAEILPDSPVDGPEPVSWAQAATLWIHLWRMPLFMVLAGFFAQMVLEKRGARAFLEDRALRLGLTLAVFMWLHNLAAGHPLGKLEHLWFIWWLLIFCGVAAVIHRLGIPIPALPTTRLGGFAALLLTATVLSAIGRNDGVEGRIPEWISDFDMRGLAYHFALFFAGQMLWRGRHGLNHLARPRVWGGCLALGLIAFLALAALWHDEDVARSAGLWISSALSAFVMVGHVAGFIGFTQWAMRGPNRLLDALTRLAYPVYVLHLYPVLTATAVFYEAGLSPVAAVASGCGVTIAMCASIYWVMRWTPLDWLFAGPRHAWWRWPLPPKDG